MTTLHHYIVVRRDLPFGTICAMIAHAAGESFFQLGQHAAFGIAQSRAPESNREDDGSHPSSGFNLPHDGSLAQMAEQLPRKQPVTGSTPVGASIAGPVIDPSLTTVVILGARNEHKLQHLVTRLTTAGVPHVAIHEPAAPYDGQLMAVGLEPGPKAHLALHVNEFHMLRFETAEVAQ